VYQLFNHPFINTGAEGAVKTKFVPQAVTADIFTEIARLQMPAAAMAEGRQVPLDSVPAPGADQLSAVSAFYPPFAGRAGPGVQNFHQAVNQSAKHSYIITTKCGFVKIFKSCNNY